MNSSVSGRSSTGSSKSASLWSTSTNARSFIVISRDRTCSLQAVTLSRLQISASQRFWTRPLRKRWLWWALPTIWHLSHARASLTRRKVTSGRSESSCMSSALLSSPSRRIICSVLFSRLCKTIQSRSHQTTVLSYKIWLKNSWQRTKRKGHPPPKFSRWIMFASECKSLSMDRSKMPSSTRQSSRSRGLPSAVQQQKKSSRLLLGDPISALSRSLSLQVQQSQTHRLILRQSKRCRCVKS